MEKITLFGRQELGVLRMEIQTALDNIKTKYGLTDLILENIRFTDNSFTSKISGKTQGDEIARFDVSEAKFFALRHGLPEDIINREFYDNGRNFTIKRLETRNIKYPVIANCKENGRNYKFSVEQIRENLGTKIIQI